MLSKNQLGFLYMFLSICAFSLMDVIVKWSVEYPIGQVLFFRGFFGIVFYFFIIPKDRLHNFYETKRPGLHFLRCFSGLIALIAIFIALRKLPLATVVSISFAAPIFTTIFSIFLLNEKVGIFRWMAVIVGFIGIIIITEPGISQLNIYYIFPIIFCLGLSYVAITIRQLSTTLNGKKIVTPIISAIMDTSAHKLNKPIIILANVLAIIKSMVFFLQGF